MEKEWNSTQGAVRDLVSGPSIRVCTPREQEAIDAEATRVFGISTVQLMENAGRSVVDQLLRFYPTAGLSDAAWPEILIFAGKGQNAGDAFVIARQLFGLQRKIRVFLLGKPSEYEGAALLNFEILQKLKVKITPLSSSAELLSYFQSGCGPFLSIDGILGTGLKGALTGLFADVVELINAHSKVTVALDIPSGVDGESGAAVGASVFADLTVTFGFPKLGHFLSPGAGRRGRLICTDISLPPQFASQGNCFLNQKNRIATLLGERDRYGHKNSFGHTLLIGGSPGRTGAIVMATKACHKMGTGLVTASTWEESSSVLLNRIPDETMFIPIREQDMNRGAYEKVLATFSSVVIGPGLGVSELSRKLLELLLKTYEGPVVLDADALNLIAEYKLFSLLHGRKFPCVLTPHPGEMARLLQRSKDSVVENPLQALHALVEKTRATVVLKGAATFIQSLQGKTVLNHYPNDGMATAGSGDVLAGMIGGMLGQKMHAFDATCSAVYLHSLAGDFAAQRLGHRSMTATDIIGEIGSAFQDLKETKQQPRPHPGAYEIR